MKKKTLCILSALCVATMCTTTALTVAATEENAAATADYSSLAAIGVLTCNTVHVPDEYAAYVASQQPAEASSSSNDSGDYSGNSSSAESDTYDDSSSYSEPETSYEETAPEESSGSGSYEYDDDGDCYNTDPALNY